MTVTFFRSVIYFLAFGWAVVIGGMSTLIEGGDLGRLMAQEGTAAQKGPALDTQEESIPRRSGDETVAGFDCPEGFSVDLFAAEPMVRQPIGCAWDDAGRLWIAENETYSERQVNFHPDLKDRIVILNDTDGDGRADQRKVFHEELQRLTSVEIGYGGVWAMAPPSLYFIPDADGDDVPDGPAEVVLDGFDADSVRHNLANGLKWGPDGWLYGRHGILAGGKVGPPDATEAERVAVGPGIWRYHPVEKRCEMVTHGTTNPWGSDWDAHGNLFFINTVIGHLWHAIPNAHLQRMYGEDADPHIYQLLPQVADHVHWNSSAETWSDIRKIGISPETDKAGGGHAHVGMMIYQGANWPEAYRHQLYTINYHGKRINRERLERQGAGYVGKHQPDLFQVEDPWFRGIDLVSGPEGAVYLLDWSDIGECHDDDGIHRSSGRIYRLRYGKAQWDRKALGGLSDLELIERLADEDVWHRRMARRVLVDRNHAGKLSQEAIERLKTVASLKTDGDPGRLESLWTLASLGEATPEWLMIRLTSSLQGSYRSVGDASYRIACLRLLLDRPTDDPAVGKTVWRYCQEETDPLGWLYAAALVGNVRSEEVWGILASLLAKVDLEKDRDYPAVLWSGMKDHVSRQRGKGLELLNGPGMKSMDRWIARRLASDWQHDLSIREGIADWLASGNRSEERAHAVLLGMLDALQGRRRVEMPERWRGADAQLRRSVSPEIQSALDRLGLLMADGVAEGQLMELVSDSGVPINQRREAIRSLSEARSSGLRERLKPLLADRDLGRDAIVALGMTGQNEAWDDLLEVFPRLPAPGRRAAIETLAANRTGMIRLVDSIEEGVIARDEVPAATLRQLHWSGDPALQGRLEKLWPAMQWLTEEGRQRMAALADELTEESVSEGNATAGRALWNKHCASCHKLFGEGGAIGPELTGAQRGNIRYWIENIADPSASVADRFRVSLFLLRDGRIVTGVPLQEDPQVILVQTPTERTRVLKEDLEERRASTKSLMPDGLMDLMTAQERQDLMKYLMSPIQVTAAP